MIAATESTPTTRLLLIDDDTSVREALSDYLRQHGFEIEAAADASGTERALHSARVQQKPFDLLVLDVMLPGEDGLSMCKRLSPKGTPILILSALGEPTDRIIGLELGAADYLSKPFVPRELLARVRAILRRVDTRESSGACAFAGWTFKPSENLLRDPSDKALALTANEYRLLRAFVEQPQRLLNRDRLLHATRGDSSDSFDRAVDLAVSRLRRKLSSRDRTALIETVRGEGYRWLVSVQRL